MQWTESDMIGRWISFLYRYCQIYMDKHLGPRGIGSGQFIFMLVLYLQDGITPERLADILNIDKGTTSVALKKLADAGYIEREPNPHDRRSYQIHITEKANRVERDFQETLVLWTELLTENFTEQEKHEASLYLKRMHDNAARVLRRERGLTDGREPPD